MEQVYVESSEVSGVKEWSINVMGHDTLELVKNGLEKELETINKRISNCTSRIDLMGHEFSQEVIQKLTTKKDKAVDLIRKITYELKSHADKR